MVTTAFLGDDVDYRDPLVREFMDALMHLNPELHQLGHSYARLDANARMFISRHLVHVVRNHRATHTVADLRRADL